ncbi:MAG: kdpD [Cyanobacteria bacterium RYN_339]|nr:kdpD [Cyanobacteria bacterium RYN_339]
MNELWLGWPDRPRDAAEGWAGYGWAVGSVLASTILAALLHGRVAEANLVMIYVLGVLPVALRGDAGPALATALLGVLAYDFFFVTPFFTFEVSDTQYLFTFLVMWLVGATISTLTARLSAGIATARQGERRARALYELSRSLWTAREPLGILAEGVRVIGAELGHPVEAWLRDPAGEPLPAGPPRAMSASEHELVRWVLREGQPAGPGTHNLPGSHWLLVPIGAPDQVRGALGILFGEGEATPGPETRAALETGANLLALALDQTLAREEAAAALAQADAERVRSAMLATVSHDLRTPLTGIVGAASSLVAGAETLTPAVRRELAQGVVEESERLARLVTNLLHATRLDAGAATLAREWCALEDALAPALARVEAEDGRHLVQVVLPPDLPLLHADPVLLELVFGNLVENAFKHSPAGTRVEVRAWQAAGQLVVEVADDGPGLPAGAEVRLFEKFARGSASRGAGLGLAICRGVIAAHGGTIGASNRPTGGAAFRITLPLEEGP